MKITLAGFGGANQAVQPRLLPESVGTVSLNQRPGGGDFQPWAQPSTVATVPANQKTIYRFGRDNAVDNQYWFSLSGVGHFVRGFIASDTTERTYYTGSGAPRVTDSTIAIASAPYPTSSLLLGVPKPVSAITLTQTTAGTGDDELRFYTQTFVTDCGEESAPGPTSSITCKPGAIIDFGTLELPASNHGITERRIYRTQAGQNGAAEFFFLREDLATQQTGITDDARALGADALATTGWEMPPADLKQLTAMWNGIMSGISGRSIRFCEPFKPYAWPIAYEVLPPDVTPVAQGVWSTNLIVLTNGRPRVITGSSPDVMNDDPVEFDAACVSEQSVQSFGHGVCWASPDGLAYLGSKGAAIITAGLMRPEQWRALAPETMVGAQYEGLYIGFYFVGGQWKGFAVDPLNPTGMYMLSQGYPAAYFDKLRNSLFVLDGTNVRKWAAGPAFMTGTFRSKTIVMPRPVSLACARVIADAYPLTFRLYAGATLLHTQTVSSREPFRLPGGSKHIEYHAEIEGAVRVTAAEMATSMQELIG